MNSLLIELLKSICAHLELSKSAYQNYLAQGKTFQYAKDLRLHNSTIMRLIKENRKLFPVQLVDDGDALIEHYEAWTAKWDALEQELNPQPNDVFVFENDIRFPREAANRLEDELHRSVVNDQ